MRARIHRAFDFQRQRYIPLPKRKRRIALQMLDISRSAGNKVIHRDYVVALGNQPVTEMRADKTGRARHYESQVCSKSSIVTNCDKLYPA